MFAKYRKEVVMALQIKRCNEDNLTFFLNCIELKVLKKMLRSEISENGQKDKAAVRSQVKSFQYFFQHHTSAQKQPAGKNTCTMMMKHLISF